MNKPLRRASNKDPEVLHLLTCRDCNMNTHEKCEYYMVRHELWRTYVTILNYKQVSLRGQSWMSDGVLCVGCFEELIGRELTKDDFLFPCPLNEDSSFLRSRRLCNRLGIEFKTNDSIDMGDGYGK